MTNNVIICSWMEFDCLGEMSPEKDCWWQLSFQHPEQKLSKVYNTNLEVI